MRWLYKTGFTVTTLLLLGCATSSSKLVGSSVPAARFYMLDGDVLTPAQFRGKHTVVLFWATTCTFSRSVIERLNDYAAKYGRQKNLEVIAVSIDKAEDLPKLRERITYSRLNHLRHAFSGNEHYDEAFIAFNLDTLPFVFVIDPDGTIRAAGSDDDVVYDYFK